MLLPLRALSAVAYVTADLANAAAYDPNPY